MASTAEETVEKRCKNTIVQVAGGSWRFARLATRGWVTAGRRAGCATSLRDAIETRLLPGGGAPSPSEARSDAFGLVSRIFRKRSRDEIFFRANAT